jgi:hypothetical protein
MNHLKKFRPYSILTLEEYEDILYKVVNNKIVLKTKVFTLDYRDQESIISFLKTKFKVTESLDTNLFIDNQAVIGFNKVDIDVSCWINIRTYRKMPPTKKWMNGRKVDLKEHEIVISKIDDEWFLVRGVMTSSGSSEEVKCDQLSGLLEYFEDRF